MVKGRAYLSILEWPKAWTEADRARMLVDAAGLDEYTARLAARRGVPQIARWMDPDEAALAVGRLAATGVRAIAPDSDAMRTAGAPRRARRLSAAIGADMYQCEMWRGEAATLRMDRVVLFVLAQLRKAERRVSQDPTRRRAMVTGMAVGGVEGALLGAALTGPAASATTRTTVSHVLDIYTGDGQRLRIDSDKFGFDVLGPERGVTDRESMSRLVERFARQAPRAPFDRGFESFACPADVVRTHFTDAGSDAVTRTSETPAFEFYSAWVWAVFRAGGATAPAAAPPARPATPRSRWPDGVCLPCGYDMTGTPLAERCPECGSTWEENQRARL